MNVFVHYERKMNRIKALQWYIWRTETEKTYVYQVDRDAYVIKVIGTAVI